MSVSNTYDLNDYNSNYSINLQGITERELLDHNKQYLSNKSTHVRTQTEQADIVIDPKVDQIRTVCKDNLPTQNLSCCEGCCINTRVFCSYLCSKHTCSTIARTSKCSHAFIVGGTFGGATSLASLLGCTTLTVGGVGLGILGAYGLYMVCKVPCQKATKNRVIRKINNKDNNIEEHMAKDSCGCCSVVAEFVKDSVSSCGSAAKMCFKCCSGSNNEIHKYAQVSMDDEVSSEISLNEAIELELENSRDISSDDAINNEPVNLQVSRNYNNIDSIAELITEERSNSSESLHSVRL